MNNENELRHFIIDSIPSQAHLVDIPDEGKKLIKLIPQQAKLIASVIQQKPYDLAILYKGVYCALELKNVDSSLTFNSNLVKTHQYENLLKVKECKGLAYVVVRFKKGLKAREKKRLKITGFNVDKTFAIDVEWLIENKDHLSFEVLEKETMTLEKDIFTNKYNLLPLWKTKK